MTPTWYFSVLLLVSRPELSQLTLDESLSLNWIIDIWSTGHFINNTFESSCSLVRSCVIKFSVPQKTLEGEVQWSPPKGSPPKGLANPPPPRHKSPNRHFSTPFPSNPFPSSSFPLGGVLDRLGGLLVANMAQTRPPKWGQNPIKIKIKIGQIFDTPWKGYILRS